ncbi:MAG: hypothetical protein ACK58L_01470, partial [Planctomycetota bacterium]
AIADMTRKAAGSEGSHGEKMSPAGKSDDEEMVESEWNESGLDSPGIAAGQGSSANGSTGHEKYLALLMQASRVGYDYELYDQCEELLELAIECDPLNESARRAMGLLLKEKKQDYERAEEYFAWCHEQLPGDLKLEELRRECRRLAANRKAESRRVNPASFRRQ